MRPFAVEPIIRFKGKIRPPGDKSIAHRSIILSALTPATTRIDNFPFNKDCLATVKAFQSLGIKITRHNNLRKDSSSVTVEGKGLRGLNKPKNEIFVGESGTTLRLISGVLSAQHFTTRLTAGDSLSHRPMLRVTRPLRLMGAKIKAKVKSMKPKIKSQKLKVEEYPPLTIKGQELKGISYKVPVPSAQVKSALLLAALYIKGRTTVIEPLPTRDHTERMLKLFKAGIKLHKNTIVMKGKRVLTSPKKIFVPGDISSAAFFMVLGVITPQARILIKNVSLNPSRTGIIKVLKRMGASIKVKSQKAKDKMGEPWGDILVKSSRLKGIVVRGEEMPSIIDELPILMVAACYARGLTVFEGINELRVKETDRIRSMVTNLRKMGAQVTVSRCKGIEKVKIRGVLRLKGAKVRSFLDHRTAMSMIVAGLSAEGKTHIDDVSCINKSFPNFLKVLKHLMV